MFNDLVTALLFFLPAGIANATPVITAKLPLLSKLEYPLDCYWQFRGQRIFGDHKTWRGLITGAMAGILTAGLVQLWYLSDESLSSFLSFDLASYNFIIFGILASFGALLGDAVKSFFKRRVNIKPGEAWIPFDQIDYIIGGIILISVYIRPPLLIYLYIFVLYFGLHLLSSFIGYLLKLKSKPI